MSEYGFFDDERKEYIVTDPRTPVKWINYIGTLNFGGFVDHTGGALLCKGDPAQNRITRYVQVMPSHEVKGTTLYTRIRGENGYEILSPFFVPGMNDYEKFETRVGLQYTIIHSIIKGVSVEAKIFVPIKDQVEIRDIRVKNLSDKELDIDVVPVVEYSFPQALMLFTNNDWVPQISGSWLIDGETDIPIITQAPFFLKDTKVNYFTSNTPVSSFETDRKEFLGENEYGTWAKPVSLLDDELKCNVARRGDNVCALMHRIGKMKPGEEKRIITQLGQDESVESARPQINKYRKPEEVDKAFNDLNGFWEEYLSSMQVETPDQSLNSMLNIHNPRQCYITKNWSRYLSYYQLGMGARGIGFRDSSQDVMGVLNSVPDEGRDLIEMLLSIQREEGSAYHQMNPMTKEASTGEAEGEFAKDGIYYYGDDHLWIVLAISEYLKETGDYGFLEKKIPYYDKKGRKGDKHYSTVLDHMERAVEFTSVTTGEHGLPLLGYADWNDTVNLPKGAESLMVANKYGAVLCEMISLYEHLGNDSMKKKMQKLYDKMKANVNKYAWDGEWWIRYFTEKGDPLGSKNNDKCSMYANAQSWPVISGFADRDRAEKTLDSLNKHLNTENGIKVLKDGYNGFDENVGGISTYPPGAKENGGIFLHTNPWIMIAETIMGNGDRAFQYYNQINPAAKNDQIDVYELEPYVYAQNILSDEHPQFGLGRNSWLSGTSSWTYQAGTKYILGVRPEHKGLCIDPCIPSEWDGIKVRRRFRGAEYDIKVDNKAHVSKGVKSVTVDGSKIEGNIIPPFSDGKKHSVEVVMG